MRGLTHDIETLIAQLPPGADQARAMTAIAQSAYLRDDADVALLWCDRALALADEFDLPSVRLAALVEKGSTLAERPQTAADGRTILSGLVDEAEKAGEWVLAARALNALVHGVPPTTPAEHAEILERMRAAAERAGFESLSVATYFQGGARLALRAGDLRAAITALEEGREQDLSYRRRAAGPITTVSSWPGSTWRPASWTGSSRSSTTWRHCRTIRRTRFPAWRST